MISHLFRTLTITFVFVCVFVVLPSCERRDWQASQTERAAQQSTDSGNGQSARVENRKSTTATTQASANKAVSLSVAGSTEQRNLSGTAAESGSTFLIIETHWENIHPKQKVSKDKLEGKTDRTMGVGGLGSGGGSSEPVEYVEMDVAYKVPKLVDHIYALVDGQAIALHPAMSTLSNGIKPESPFGIGKQGEVRDLQLAFLVPRNSKNIALQVFDYSNGHLLVPLRGNAELAKHSRTDRGDALDEVSTDVVELAALGLDFANDYAGQAAGTGWKFAVVKLGGQSVSGRDGGMGKILQFDPTKYVWVNADSGFIYYATGGSTDTKGNIRFTPEIYQQQEVAFRVPAAANHLSMGLRVNKDIVTLLLTDRKPIEMPGSRVSHRDGDVMEILLHGTRRDGDYLILDLGIKPIVQAQGLEVRTARQFLLQTADGELKPDAKATAALTGHPPDPFVIPPGVSVRFELAYRTAAVPTALRVRGYRSEGKFEL